MEIIQHVLKGTLHELMLETALVMVIMQYTASVHYPVIVSMCAGPRLLFSAYVSLLCGQRATTHAVISTCEA